MEEKKSASNVIQFPGKRKEGEAETVPPPPASPKPPRKGGKSKKNLIGAVIAVVLATGAVNRFAFDRSRDGSSELVSLSGRGLASVTAPVGRDALWEKQLAESLASVEVRDVAAVQVGRLATAEEKLRWAALGEKYTIVYRPDAREIESILLQNQGESSPSYVLNRRQFLKEYGVLFASGFASAKLKSVKSVAQKTYESYTLLDQNARPKAEALFELDVHERLLSFKVERAEL